MRFNIYHVVGIAWIALWVGLAAADVGEMSSNGPYPWHLPLTTLLAFGFPFVLGVLAGRNEK